MKPEIQVDVRSLFLGVGIVVVLTAVFTVSVFSMGQQNGLRLAAGAAALPGSPDPASGVIKGSTEELPALPKAMTATPQAKDGVMITLSETQANQFAMDQVNTGGIGQALQVQQILFTERRHRITRDFECSGLYGGIRDEWDTGCPEPGTSLCCRQPGNGWPGTAAVPFSAD